MRLFIALELPPETKTAVAAAIATQRASGLRWVKPEGVHLTLVFLGETPEAKLAGLKSTLDEVAARHPPLRLELSGAGTFGRPASPRVLWLGVKGELPVAAALQHDLAVALGAVEDRPWSAHLTLARARRDRGEPAMGAVAQALDALRVETFGLDSITLFETRGGRYVELHRAMLLGGASQRE